MFFEFILGIRQLVESEYAAILKTLKFHPNYKLVI